MRVVNTSQMRWAEERAAALGMPSPALMQNAGRAVADVMQRIAGSLAGRRVLVLVGPGNNGGDGLVTARHLHDAGAIVTCYLWNRHQAPDPNLILLEKQGIPAIRDEQDQNLLLLQAHTSIADYTLDALLGTGRARPIEGRLRDVLDTVREHRRGKIVTMDLPTGLDPDTGRVDPACLAADHTVTLGYPKLGLLLFPGAAYAGHLTVAGIGLPGEDPDTGIEMLTGPEVAAMLPSRPLQSHKGTFGKVLVIAGSANYTGAPYLAAMAAVRIGAGLATLATARSVHPIVAAAAHEVTHLPLPETEDGAIGAQAIGAVGSVLPSYDALIIGPGLGMHPETQEFMGHLLQAIAQHPPAKGWLIDADGLNILAAHPDWLQHLPERGVLTPHPGEMGRLTRASLAAVQEDRLQTAHRAALAWKQIVVLKGAHTLIAAPEGEVTINPAANPALATAGTGDVLAGAIAGFLAQGLPPESAAVVGAYVHGLAGELARETLGEAGVVATDLLLLLPQAIRELQE